MKTFVNLKEIIFTRIQNTFSLDWLQKCSQLTNLVFPIFHKKFHYKFLSPLTNLKNLTISRELKFKGDRLYGTTFDGCLYSIELPTSIETVNGTVIEFKQLQSFTLPTNVTKIGEYCFYKCSELKEIIGMKQIKEIAQNAFYRCLELNIEDSKVYNTFNKLYYDQLLLTTKRKQLMKSLELII